MLLYVIVLILLGLRIGFSLFDAQYRDILFLSLLGAFIVLLRAAQQCIRSRDTLNSSIVSRHAFLVDVLKDDGRAVELAQEDEVIRSLLVKFNSDSKSMFIACGLFTVTAIINAAFK